MPNEARTHVEHELFIRSFMAFTPPARVLSQLVNLMHDMFFDSGDVVYREGEPANRLYFIITGRVELHSDAEPPWTLEDRSLIGIVDAAQQRPHSRTATVRKATHVIALNYSDYLDILEDNFEYARAFLTSGAARHEELALEAGPLHVFPGVATPTTGFGATRTGPLSSMERLFALRATPMFQDAPVQALASLAQLATQAHFERGASLFTAGDMIKVLHVLVSGRVRMERESPRVDALFTPTRVLGGLAAFGQNRRKYQAIAETDADVLVIQKEDLFDVMEDHFGLARSLFARITQERERIMLARQTARSLPNARANADSARENEKKTEPP